MARATRSRILLPAAAPALVLALTALTGCQGAGTQAAGAGQPARSAPPPSAAPPTAPAPAPPSGAALADPLPDPLPAGTKVVLQRSGAGPQPLDLTGLVGTSAAVTVHWLCAGGTGGLRLTDRSAVVVGSDCAGTPAQATTAFTGVVPPATAPDLAWKVQAGPGTVWRVAVTTAS